MGIIFLEKEKTETWRPFETNLLSKILAVEKMKGTQIHTYQAYKTESLRAGLLILMYTSLEKYFLPPET